MAEINPTHLREAVAWVANERQPDNDPDPNPFVWFWQAVQGDFNENRSTAQILTDAGISMIPLVDQVCDVRDLIANCRKLSRDITDMWAWVALVLTVIGLFPSIGSLVKGVLKIFFAFIRNSGGAALGKAVDDAMTWVITYLRRRDVQQYLKRLQVDDTFGWLAEQIKAIRSGITKAALLAAFDRGIKALEELTGKVSYVPSIGAKAKRALEEVKRIRLSADANFGKVIRPVQDLIDTVVLRLEKAGLESRHAVLDVGNVHYRGALPEATAARLMLNQQPHWLSKTGDTFVDPADVSAFRNLVDARSAKFDMTGKPRPSEEIFPYLSDRLISSFHTLAPHVIRGPARLYRILSPNSRAMSDCWVTQEVFERLQSSPNPKEAWRRYLAVWPDWNVNGQFVIYDLKAGETLNTWKGPASSQKRADLPDRHLEGGWEQIVFNVERSDIRNDTVLYYPVINNSGQLGKPLSQDEVNRLTGSMNDAEKQVFNETHLSLREKINHPNISGPFETGWGYNEFNGSGLYARIGLPTLPGQITNIPPK